MKDARVDRLPQELCVPKHDYAVTHAVTADGTMMSFTGCVQVLITIKEKAIETDSDITWYFLSSHFRVRLLLRKQRNPE